MLDNIRISIRKRLLSRWNLLVPIENARWSYAQEGEDVLLWRILDAFHGMKGTYVDVGSNHPWKNSNTALFYRSGWRGVAVDPNPIYAEDFAKERPGDVFLNIGLSDVSDMLTYHSFLEPLYNTFSEAYAKQLVENGIQPFPIQTAVVVRTLREVLPEIWPSGKAIDLLSIDAEGFDSNIISGHDFLTYPVSFLICEFEKIVISAESKDPLVEQLEAEGFVLISKLWKSAIFLNRKDAPKFGITF